jgi:pyruvate formate lyase activating enzyme
MLCNYCERRCNVREGGTGFCRMYTVSNRTITERFPHRWSSCGTQDIESMPFYHVYPGSRCLVIGTTGCNFVCRYCSNAHIAKEDPESQQAQTYNLSPEEVVAMARKFRCRSIVFNVNEPTVSLLSVGAVGEEAAKAGIPMGCLTNAYTTVESTKILASVFSFFNVSLKGISAPFNKAYIGIESSGPVLRNIRQLAKDRHVEITTPVIQGINDTELDEMADFIVSVDRAIPWHVFRLLPEDEMKGDKYPSIQAIDRALGSAREKLDYVYFHNFVGSDWVDTLCPDCGNILIERFSLGCGGDKLKRTHCEEGVCPHCGRKISLVTEGGHS